MKGNRAAALVLALILSLSLLVLPAGAVSFTDMTNHWAREDVEYLAGLGIVKGLSATTFGPDRKMTACEALLFCSRATGVPEEEKKAIAAQYEEYLGQTLPESVYSWAKEEMAVCLETGIVSTYELEALCQSGALLKAISRENLAMYLVRAMQLAPLAQSLSSYPMNFADTSSITQSLRPYVYLLATYGVVRGNPANQFQPQGELTRAEMATMLCRAIDFMDDQGIYAELPAYTTYAWTGGVVQNVTAGPDGGYSVALVSNLTGSTTCTLPVNTPIYENNMRTTPSSLREGQYIRVNTNSDGSIHSVRIGGALTLITGTVSSIAQDSIVLLADGLSKRLPIDRFTQVQVGQQVGGQTLIYPAARYTQAQCWVDSMGHLAELKLTGDSWSTQGTIRQVVPDGAGVTISVADAAGKVAAYHVAAATPVTRDGAAATLGALQPEDSVTLTISGNQVLTLEAQSPSTAGTVQGTVLEVDVQAGTLLFKTVSGDYLQADLTRAGILDASGTALTLSDLKAGDRVQLYGSRVGAIFTATLAVRM